VKQQLEILCQLQALEQKRSVLAIQKAKIDATEVRQLWQEIKFLGQKIAADQEKIDCLKKVSLRQQEDLAILIEKCEAAEAKMYSGKITNLKELEEMKNKSEAARKEIGGFENEVLMTMEQCDQLTNEVVTQEELLAQKRQQHSQCQHILVKTLADFEDQIAKIEAECKILSRQVEGELLRRFRELSRKQAMPIARVENNVCGGCRMSMPASRLVSVAGEILHCENCGRILYID